MDGKFELLIGFLGNGITVWNMAAMEHGDYKKIAHISTGGNIKLYEPEEKIPPVAIEKIERMASKNKDFKGDNKGDNISVVYLGQC